MTLTSKSSGREGIVKPISRFSTDNWCLYGSGGYLEYIGNIEDYKEYQPKEKVMKYEVVKPFSILELCRRGSFSGDLKLLQEYDNESTPWKFFSIEQVLKSKTLSKRLPWLCESGFIKEFEEEVILKVGMKLRFKPASSEDVVELISSSHNDILYFYNEREGVFYPLSESVHYKEGDKLSDLNKHYLYGDYEVV